MRSSPSNAPTDPQRRYDALVDEAMRLANRLSGARGPENTALLQQLDQLFAKRVTLLRQQGTFTTLEQQMPSLLTIVQRARTERTSATIESIRHTFRFVDDSARRSEADSVVETVRRGPDTSSQQPQLTSGEIRDYYRARRSVLEKVGCTLPDKDRNDGYSNMLIVHKDGYVVHLAQDAVPHTGLPGAERISGVTILPYRNGQAEALVGSYHRGKWLRPIADRKAQRVLDEIAAVVG
jgi:hypothetical protein